MAAVGTTNDQNSRPAGSLRHDSQARMMAAFRVKFGELVAARSAIGSMPPQPPTRRAQMGAYLVRQVRRALFWLLPQFDRFHAAVIEAIDHQSRLIGEMGTEQREFEARVRRRIQEAPDR